MDTINNAAQNVRNFWNRHAQTFLPDWLRDQLVDTATVFDITAVRDGKTKFGATWFVDIVANGNSCTVPMSHNDVRDTQLLAIKAGLEQGEFQTLPAILISFPTNFENMGYSFAPPTPEYYEQLGIPMDTSQAQPVDLDTVPY